MMLMVSLYYGKYQASSHRVHKSIKIFPIVFIKSIRVCPFLWRILNPLIFSTVEYLRCFIETAHSCSTCDFRPLKFCYLGAVEIYKLLSVPIKKPMCCLTTKLISKITKENKTHSMVPSCFFKLKKGRFPDYHCSRQLSNSTTPNRPQM